MTPAEDASVGSAAWQRLGTAATMVDVLLHDEDVTDVVELTGAHVPPWIVRRAAPARWQTAQIDPAALGTAVAPARIATYQPAGSTPSPMAVETVNVFGFTGHPGFREVISHAACTFTDLGATDVRTTVLPVPVRCWTAAVRSSGIFSVAGQPMWGQQSNYLAGSEHRHTGRLIVHSIYVAAGDNDPQLTSDIATLSEAVYTEFLAALATIPVS